MPAPLYVYTQKLKPAEQKKITSTKPLKTAETTR